MSLYDERRGSMQFSDRVRGARTPSVQGSRETELAPGLGADKSDAKPWEQPTDQPSGT